MSAKKNLPKTDPRMAAREQIAAQRAEQARRDKRSKLIAISILVAAVIAFVVVIAVILNQGKTKPLTDTPGPAGVTATGGITFGKERVAGTTNGKDAVELGVYVDFTCSYCVEFELANGEAINKMLADGDATLVLYPVNVLKTPFSADAADATAYLADKAPDKALDFFAAVFATNPNVNGPLSQDQMRAIALQVGVEESVAKKMFDGTWTKWVDAASAYATEDPALKNEDGKFGTPTITINRERLDAQYNWTVDGQLALAVAAAKK